MRILKNSFNAGEFSPKLYGRYDLDKYASGCKTLQNMVVTPHGGVVRRPGTKYITSTYDSTRISRLIPFEFSVTQSYVIEMAHEKIGFFRNDAAVRAVDANTRLLLHGDGLNQSTTITDDGTNAHTMTANGTCQLTNSSSKFGSTSIYFDGDSDYISADDHADWDIFSQTNFTIEFWIKHAAQPSDPNNFCYMCQYEDVSNYWLIYHGYGGNGINFYAASGTELLQTGFSSTAISDTDWHHVAVIKVGNEYGIYLDGSQGAYVSDSDTDTYAGSLEIGRFGDGSDYTNGLMDEVRIYFGNPFSAAPNSGKTDAISIPQSTYPDWDSTGTVYRIDSPYKEEHLRELQFTQSADVMYITHNEYATRTLSRTSEASWALAAVNFSNAPTTWGSSSDGYPACVTFYEDRLALANNYENPDTIWFSKVGSYTSFSAGSASSDDAITLTLAARRINPIHWLASTRRLLAGTYQEEWWASGPSDTEPITPTNKVAKRDSANGSKLLMPIEVGNTIIYLQRQGNIIRELNYDFGQDKYVSTNLTLLSDHLFDGYTIYDMAYQQHPYQIVWCVRSDGTLLGLTYMQEHKVYAWHKHVTDGTIESIACIPGEDEDELWMTVNRTINGSAVRYIEKLGPFNYGDIEDAYYVDCGISVNFNGLATSIGGLTHLEGESVDALYLNTSSTLSTATKNVLSGSITVGARQAQVGLGYNSDLETLDVLYELKDGITAGIKKRITNVYLLLFDSLNGQFGPDSSNLVDIPYASSTASYTGWTKDLSFEEGHESMSTIYVRQADPLPLGVMAINIDLEDE